MAFNLVAQMICSRIALCQLERLFSCLIAKLNGSTLVHAVQPLIHRLSFSIVLTVLVYKLYNMSALN